MRNNISSLLKWLIVLLILGAAVVAVLDVDGWRAFVFDIALAFFVQAVIALVLFGVFVAILGAVSFRSRNALLSAFFVAAIVALPVMNSVFHRSLDIYDAAQTVVLIMVFSLLLEPAKRFFRSLEPSPAVPPPAGRPTPLTTWTTLHASESYRELLNLARGDKELVERLIEYERKYTPYASREERTRSALERWIRDHQR
jgi:hypothetical protein